MGAEQDHLPCGPTGTSSGNSQEMESRIARGCQALRQPLQNHFEGILEGGRRRGRQRKCWMDNVHEWTSLSMPEMFTMASRRKDMKMNIKQESEY